MTKRFLAFDLGAESGRAMLGQLAEQYFFSQRTLDLVLDQARHRPGTHLCVVAALGQPAARLIRHLERDMLVFQLRLQLDDTDRRVDGLQEGRLLVA